MKITLLGLLLFFAALLPLAAQTPPPTGAAASQEAPKTSPGAALVEKGSYAEAVPLLEAELKADPQSRDLLYAKVKALAGMGRNVEARGLAVQTMLSHKDWPEFRYQAGECSWNLGQAQQAIQFWAPLFPDAEWGGVAMASAARAMLASGREQEAKELVLGAVAKQEKPAPVLLRQALDLDRTGPGCLKILGKLMESGPESKDEYLNLRKIYASIGGGKLLDETLSGSLPATIPLKERSGCREVATLLNGSLFDNDILAKTDDVRTTRESLAPPQIGPPTSETIQSGRGLTVPVSIMGGREELMLLDSGAGFFMVSPKVARANGLEPVTAAYPWDFGKQGGERLSKWVVLRELTIGPLTVKNVPAAIIEKQADEWQTIAGVFPLAAMSGYGILFDRRGGRIVLYPSGTPPETALGEGFATVQCLWVSGKPVIQARVQQVPNLLALVSIGAERTCITDLGATAASISPFPKQAARNVGLRIAFVDFHLASAEVAPMEKGFSPPYAAAIGRDIWDLFTIYFDPSHGAMSFQAARK